MRKDMMDGPRGHLLPSWDTFNTDLGQQENGFSSWAVSEQDSGHWHDQELGSDDLGPHSAVTDEYLQAASLLGNEEAEDEAGSENVTPKAGKKGAIAERKTTKNALACRRHREKRKREVEELRKRNEELELEKDLLAERIATLQSDVQIYRFAGAVNLEKENELLRAEVKKYKSFVHEIISATDKVPYRTPEEEYREWKTCVSSATRNVVGLLYASSVDPSWIQGESFIVDGNTVHLKYQVLPFGATSFKEVKRLNCRFTMENVACNAEKVTDILWKFIANEKWKYWFAEWLSLGDNVERKMEHVMSESLKVLAEQNDDRFKVVRYSESPIRKNGEEDEEEEESHKTMLAVLACQTEEVHPFAFVEPYHTVDTPHGLPNDESGMETAHIMACSSAGLVKGFVSDNDIDQQHLDDDGSTKVRTNITYGDVIRPLSEKRISIVKIVSIGVTNKEQSMNGFSNTDAPLVSTDGRLSQNFKSKVSTTFRPIINPLVGAALNFAGNF